MTLGTSGVPKAYFTVGGTSQASLEARAASQ